MLSYDFDQLVKEINEKLSEAGKLLAEVNQLAQKAKLPTLAPNDHFDEWTLQEYLKLRGMKAFSGLREEQKELLKELSLKIQRIHWSPVILQLDMAGWATFSMEC